MLNQEEKFFDGFMLLLGALIGTIAGVVLFADFVGDQAAARDAEAGVSADALIEERIRPIGQVALLGDPDIGVAPTLAVAVESVRAPLSGPQVYDDNCYLCHAAPGIGGAPVFGDVDAWMPRIAQGADILREHVLNGYQGEVGVMPPKGGRLDLSDAEIFEAIDFMLQAVQ